MLISSGFIIINILLINLWAKIKQIDQIKKGVGGIGNRRKKFIEKNPPLYNKKWGIAN
jgi:hypothetical protein